MGAPTVRLQPWDPIPNDGECYTTPDEGGAGTWYMDRGCWRLWSATPALTEDGFDEIDGGTA